jgi:isocitrate dehydrogenase
MFEAIHGSAPTIAGQNIANPSGLIQGAILMLNHIGQGKVAEKIENAWLKTLEDGIHTFDIYQPGNSKKQVGTKEFAEAVIANLNQTPTTLKAAAYNNTSALQLPKYKRRAAQKKELVGIDVFIHWGGEDPNTLAELVKKIELPDTKLSMITNRGIKVWPEGFKETFCTDHWRCRFKPSKEHTIEKSDIIELLKNANDNQIDVIKTENLYDFDSKAAYSLGQGQ